MTWLIFLTLPARILHPSRKLQYEIVAALGLLALFTQMHIFWVAGLPLALMDFPDIGGHVARHLPVHMGEHRRNAVHLLGDGDVPVMGVRCGAP